MTQTPAGWYADPAQADQLRYWDGSTWTEHRHANPPAAPQPVMAPAEVPSQEPAFDISQTVVRRAPEPAQAPVGFAPAEQPVTPLASHASNVPAAVPSYAAPAAYAAPGAVGAGQQTTVAAAGRTASGAPLASGGQRLGAYLLDMVMSGLLAITIIGYFIWSMIAWGRGQTPGKQLANLVVVDNVTGQRVGWGRMFLRQFVGMGLVTVLTLGISFIVSLFMIPSGRAVWDRIAGTTVVADPQRNLR